jgi:pimeloyl-ACP methyl ester carboxylesterase
MRPQNTSYFPDFHTAPSGHKKPLFPFIVVSPQCPNDHWWEPVELAALLDEIVEKHKVDQDRIDVTGLSMGGFGTWSLAAYQPKRFAAIVPICGGGRHPGYRRRLAHEHEHLRHAWVDPNPRSGSAVAALQVGKGDPGLWDVSGGTPAALLRGVQPIQSDEPLAGQVVFLGIAVLPLATWLLWSAILQAFGFDRTGVP